jgi:hypothetical protein
MKSIKESKGENIIYVIEVSFQCKRKNSISPYGTTCIDFKIGIMQKMVH